MTDERIKEIADGHGIYPDAAFMVCVHAILADNEKDATRFRKFVEIRSYYIWSECSPEEVEKILDDYIARNIP